MPGKRKIQKSVGTKPVPQANMTVRNGEVFIREYTFRSDSETETIRVRDDFINKRLTCGAMVSGKDKEGPYYLFKISVFSKVTESNLLRIAKESGVELECLTDKKTVFNRQYPTNDRLLPLVDED